MSDTQVLTVRNVRLPSHAYEAVGFDAHDGDDVPLVDIDYTRTESGDVQVHLTPHADRVDVGFDAQQPFASICQVTTTRASCSSSASKGERRFVGQITSPPGGPAPGEAVSIDARGSLAVPGGLCHPHIHLDKCFLLDRCTLSSGTFDEALKGTATAKAGFTRSDLVARGRRLVASSLSHGVTAMRAFVEVDPTVGLRCLEAGVALKREFAPRCHLQLVAFAQDALFYADAEKQAQMHTLLRQAASHDDVDVVGSAPYVEAEPTGADGDAAKVEQKAQQRSNIDHVFALAREFGKHVDFHLDYDLEPPGSAEEGLEAMLPYVLRLAASERWDVDGKRRCVTVGHCTKLSVYSDSDLDAVGALLGRTEGVGVVALPPSDLYMQGRDAAYAQRSRATLPLLDLARDARWSGANWAMGVNNVANLFTPQGDADPLALLPTMVGVWQSAKPRDCETLLAAVSTQARAAIGLASLCSDASLWTHLVVLDGARCVQDVVCAPPYGRITIARGRLVARRKVDSNLF